jgi:hypothetical protein
MVRGPEHEQPARHVHGIAVALPALEEEPHHVDGGVGEPVSIAPVRSETRTPRSGTTFMVSPVTGPRP